MKSEKTQPQYFLALLPSPPPILKPKEQQQKKSIFFVHWGVIEKEIS